MSAFPGLGSRSRARLLERGIDPDVSLACWLGHLTGRTPGQVTDLIRVALDDPMPPVYPPPTVVALAPSERAALLLAGRGLTNVEISEALDVTAETVKCYMRRAYEKLGTSSRITAVLIAIATDQA